MDKDEAQRAIVKIAIGSGLHDPERITDFCAAFQMGIELCIVQPDFAKKLVDHIVRMLTDDDMENWRSVVKSVS